MTQDDRDPRAANGARLTMFAECVAVSDGRSDELNGPDLAALGEAEGAGPVSPELLDDLASNLLWRIGRVADDGPVTVRVGLPSSAALFQELPRLRSASDAEVEAAIQEGSLRVEWVGARLKGER